MRVVRPGLEQEGGNVMGGGKALQDFPGRRAIHVGQRGVQDNDVGRDVAGLLDGLQPGVGEENVVARHLQSDRKRFQKIVFLSDQQDLLFHATGLTEAAPPDNDGREKIR